MVLPGMSQRSVEIFDKKIGVVEAVHRGVGVNQVTEIEHVATDLVGHLDGLCPGEYSGGIGGGMVALLHSQSDRLTVEADHPSVAMAHDDRVGTVATKPYLEAVGTEGSDVYVSHELFPLLEKTV